MKTKCERVVERIGDWRCGEVVIDREAGVVRNVALAGLVSRNGYRYAESALRGAVSLYVDKPVFLDHAADVSRPQERSTRDLVGNIVNPRFEQGRIRGDIQTLGTEAGQTFLALAESSSPAVGMSHVVLVSRNNDSSVVEQIHEVVSVDAVTFPATTSSLQEQLGQEQTSGVVSGQPVFGSLESVIHQIDAQLPRRIRELTSNADATCERLAVFPSHVVVSLGEAKECERYQISWRIEDQRVRLAKTWKPVGDGGMSAESWGSPVAKSETEGPDVAELRETLRQTEAENGVLLSRLEAMTAERVLATREEMIERLLNESGLPEEAVSESFRRQLLDAEDDGEREALLRDRVGLYEHCQTPAPTSCSRSDGNEETSVDDALLRILRRGKALVGSRQ